MAVVQPANFFAVSWAENRGIPRRASTPAIGAQKTNVVGQIANLPRQVSNLPYNPDIGFLTVNSLLRRERAVLVRPCETCPVC